MICGVSTTHKVLVGPAIQVRVFSTNEAISGITGPALTLVHRVTEVADVDTFGRFVTVVGLVLAWVLWLAHLIEKQVELYYDICHQSHPSTTNMFLHVFFVLLLSASDDMFKSRVLVLPVLLVDFFFDSHSKVKATPDQNDKLTL